MNKRYAAIDIGTNTILMLIADKDDDGKLSVISDEHSIARLGECVDKTKMINENAIGRAQDILEKYRSIIEENKVEKIRIVGTSSLRDAKNSRGVIAKLEEVIGSKIDTISGIEEAELSFLGAIEDKEPSVVIDIGGGSTEIIYGKENNLIERNSLDIGAVRITERIFGEHPPKDIRITQAQDILKKELQKNIKLKYSGKYYAVAGTPTTLAAIVQNLAEYDDEKVNGYELSIFETENIFNQFLSMNVEEIVKKYKIHPKRADVITAGTLILMTIMDFFSIESVIVSSHGLRYGVMKKLISAQIDS
jgi:exopolyphosphatase/guanosine-5'-triphosphate,3'-diphosphate pyrophosphatase